MAEAIIEFMTRIAELAVVFAAIFALLLIIDLWVHKKDSSSVLFFLASFFLAMMYIQIKC